MYYHETWPDMYPSLSTRVVSMCPNKKTQIQDNSRQLYKCWFLLCFRNVEQKTFKIHLIQRTESIIGVTVRTV